MLRFYSFSYYSHLRFYSFLLIEKDGEIRPIEVKAGNTTTTSLNNFIKDFSPKIAYKFANSNIGMGEGKQRLPHYMVMFI